jgi:hypothetical protein
MRYYDQLAEYEREGYTIIVDKSWEDLNPRDMFDESCCDIDEIIKDIDRGHLDWFMLRVRVLVEDLELSSEYLGGMLYEDPKECLTDGSAEDLIDAALADAKKQVYRLSRVFTELSYAADREGVAA